MAIKRFLAVMVVVTVLAVLALLPAGGLTGRAQRSEPTLHERAKKAGGKLGVVYEPDHKAFSHDLEKLARRSDVIVVGRPLSNRGTLSPDGKSVMQDYRVRVQGVIKGDVPGGSTITVSLPGGGYRFTDGMFVSVRAKDYRQAENGKLYVFFLNAKGSGYKLAGGTQGLFNLADGTVEPASSSRNDPLVTKYKGADPGTFLKELRDAVVVKGR